MEAAALGTRTQPPSQLDTEGSRAGAALLTMWENGMSECAPKAGAGVFKAVV